LLLAPVAAAITVPVWRRAGEPLTAATQGVYRKVLALPIARGWIRA
jgi:undecaprenyl-diphosphatase